MGSVFTQAFHLAVTRLGNVDALAQELGVEASTVHNWLYGTRNPPFNYFLRVIDPSCARFRRTAGQMKKGPLRTRGI